METREYVLTRDTKHHRDHQEPPAHGIMHLDLDLAITVTALTFIATSEAPSSLFLDEALKILWFNNLNSDWIFFRAGKMKGWVRPQLNVLPIIACKNLAFNQRRCVESVGNLVWALTRTANYSKQGKFVSLVWEDAVGVQSKVRTLNDNLFRSEAENFFPSMLKSPWNFASSEAGLMTADWLAQRCLY